MRTERSMVGLLLVLMGCDAGVGGPRGAGEHVRSGMFTIRGEPELLYYEIDDGLAIFEGDVILGEVDEDERFRAAILPGAYWPDHTVPYVLAPSLPDQSKRDFLAAVDIYHAKTAVRFVARTGEPDYLEVVSGGCRSFIGHRGGAQKLELGENCGLGAAQHEIAHALGFFHEQSRIDRDDHVVIHWENIEKNADHNFKTFLEYGGHGANFGPYDFDSIMHYGSDFFARGAEPTITRLDGTAIPRANVLSAGDLAALEAMYPPPPVLQPCGDVDHRGRCDDSMLSWCTDSGLAKADCASLESSCILVDEHTGYDCVPW